MGRRPRRMSQLVEIGSVVQRTGEPARRWFTSESLDLLFWMDAAQAPEGFQLTWHDLGNSHAITARQGQLLSHERVDDGSRGGAGAARSATLHKALDDYDLALIQPRFAAASQQLPVLLRDYVMQQLGVPVAAAATPQPQWLAGLTVLVTRPLRQAKNLVLSLESYGAHARLLPLLAIRPPLDAREPASLLQAQPPASAWIFTSANAVLAAAKMHPPAQWTAPLFAVGEATTQALKSCGHQATRPPPEAIHSEGLLSLPALQHLAGQHVLIVTGEGGRDGLREPLEARGASVQVATVYRREVVPHLPQTVQATLQGVDALLLTSGESLVALHRALPAAQKAAVLKLPVVLPSSRVLAMAKSLGFTQPLLAATVSDAAFVQALLHWRRATAA